MLQCKHEIFSMSIKFLVSKTYFKVEMFLKYRFCHIICIVRFINLDICKIKFLNKNLWLSSKMAAESIMQCFPMLYLYL